MNHSQLKAFHAVAQEGSFTRAAAALQVSQPTLSGHVKSLEEGYGVTLFQRGGRRVELTEFGKSLLAITQRYFACEGEALQLLSTARGLLRGRLRIGADSPYHVVPLIAVFSRRFPTVQRSIFFGNSKEVLGNLFARKSDIAILPEIEADDRLHIIPYRHDRLVIFTHRGHPWSQRKSIRLHEIGNQTMIMREVGSSTRAVFEKAMAAKNVIPKNTLEMGSREAVRESVAAGLGIGIVCESEFGHDTRLHRLPVRDARLETVEYITCLKESRKDAVVTTFFDIVRETARAS